MGPQGGREKGGPQGRPKPPPAGEAKAPRGHGAQDVGQLQGAQIRRKPLPHQTQALIPSSPSSSRREVALSDLGTDSSLLLSGERAQHSLVSGRCGSVALSPFRSRAKCWSSLPAALPACAPGAGCLPAALDESALYQDKASAPFPSRGALSDVLTYFGD